MRRILLAAMLATASFFTACDNQSAGNAPKNTSANNSAGNTATAPAGTEADVKKMMADFEAALNKGDVAALDKMYADDYTLIDQFGAVQTKATRMDAIKSGKLKFEGLKFDDLKFKMSPGGDGAVVTGHVTGKATMDGKAVVNNSRVTWVLGKMKDGWRFVNAQITDIKGGEAKADDKKGDAKSVNMAPANK